MARPRKRAVVSPAVGLRALTGVALIALLHPSVQFPLVRSSRAQRAGPHDGDATSVPGKLAASDNTTPLQHAGPLSPPRQAHKHAHSSSSESADTVSIPRRAHTRPANPSKTNRGANFRTRHRFGETPAETLRKASAEGVVTRGGVEGSTKQKAALTDGGERQYSNSVSDESLDPQGPFSPVAPQHLDVPFTEVVQVDLHSQLTQGVDKVPVKPGGESRGGGESKALSRTVQSGSQEDVVLVGEEEEEEEGDRQLLQQPVPHRSADPHESKMVLTAVGSFTAIVGVCVMAAIFQCCCRRKRSGSRDGQQEQEEKQGLDHKNSSSRSTRSSKSPSPHIVFTKDEDEENDRGQAETDTLLDEDKDLGDFSAVQRETSILRSYRKAPPPKNRARASRVPRALKAVNQNASPNIFQELVDSEHKYDDTSKTPPTATNGLASPETSDMQSSMLADIDSTLAALHTDTVQDTSPSRSADRSREASAEKQLLAKPGSAESQLKPASTEQPLPKSSSKEQLAKALAQELSRSVSKEMLSKPQSKPVTPKSSKDTTPKSQSAGASPKTVHSDRPSASSSKDSMGSSNASDNGAGKSGSSAGEGDNHNTTNFFALIDPTAKDRSSEAGGKSKIPVRAASSPTQPTAPLRLSAGRDKRFPVPSVHGDQMDQLMKSLKTRLKDDDNASPKQTTDAVTKEGSLHDDDTDPQGRDRSHSDPTKQREDRGRALQQTHL